MKSPAQLDPVAAQEASCTPVANMERKYYGVNNPDISETETTNASPITATLVASRLRRERRAKEKNKPRRRYQVRQLKSRGALLVLLWNLLVFSHQSTVFNNLLGFFGLNQPWKNVLAAIFLQQVKASE